MALYKLAGSLLGFDTRGEFEAGHHLCAWLGPETAELALAEPNACTSSRHSFHRRCLHDCLRMFTYVMMYFVT